MFDFIEKHKIAFVIGMTLILFGLYMGVTNAIKASRADAADGNAEVSQVEAQEAGDGDEKTIDTAGLTEAQRSHVKNYSQEETAIIGQSHPFPGGERMARATSPSSRTAHSSKQRPHPRPRTEPKGMKEASLSSPSTAMRREPSMTVQ